MNPSTLTAGIVDCITTQNAVGKARNTRALVAEWRSGNITEIGVSAPPDRPGRPPLPELRPPRDVPKRRITGGVAGRVALIHAIAHIELNAIDLALDMACRYTDQSLPRDFYDDWLSVADDEARHFLMLNDRLALLDAQYGDLPAHDGLWQAAQETAHDLLGRLAIAPLVLEARGLDVTPTMINKLNDVGDHESATALGIIMHDEVGHVLIGKRWFDYVCGMHRRDPVSSWHMLVKRYFKGPLKPPFNIEAREAAHFSAAFYGPLSYRDDLVSTPTHSK
ncbi:MAG: ferritin-like domain-containing protein [Candidatus Puniceispirillum sp.]